MGDAGHDLVWAAIVTGVFSVLGVWLANRHARNMKALNAKIDMANDRLDTGNGVKIGKAVYRLEQNQDLILQNQSLQTATLQVHGQRLSELTEYHEHQGAKIDRMEASLAKQGDSLTDHLLSLEEAAEQLAAKGRLTERTEGTD